MGLAISRASKKQPAGPGLRQHRHRPLSAFLKPEFLSFQIHLDWTSSATRLQWICARSRKAEQATTIRHSWPSTRYVMSTESAVGRNKQESKRKQKNRLHFQSEMDVLRRSCDWKVGLSSQLAYFTLRMHNGFVFVNAFPVFSSQPRTPLS